VEIIVKADHKEKRKHPLPINFGLDVTDRILFACADNALQKNTRHGKKQTKSK
jgi:hypothetical protein